MDRCPTYTKQTWYNLFDLSILEMKCALFDWGIPAFDWGIPAFPILEICLVCAAFLSNLSRVRCTIGHSTKVEPRVSKFMLLRIRT